MVHALRDESTAHRDETISVFALGTIILRHRIWIGAGGLIGLFLGLALAFLPAPVYRSKALFQPQSAQPRTSELALVASNFGFGMPAGGGAGSAAMYVELLRTHTILEPIVNDTLTLGGERVRRLAVVDLLGADFASRDAAIASLRELFKAREVPEIGAVEVVVATTVASASQALAMSLVEELNRFNVVSRRSQAAEERAFVAVQVETARTELELSESKLLEFIQHNRGFASSPELQFEYDRLQREVDSRQRLYTGLTNDLAEARIREIRDTPVITILEEPRIPSEPVPRHALIKAILGLLAGMLVGALAAFASHGWNHAIARPDSEAAEFRRQLRGVFPGRRP